MSLGRRRGPYRSAAMALWPAGLQGGSARDLQARVEAERRGAPFLVLFDPEGAQHLVPLGADAGDRLSIGREPGNDVALAWDREVSRVHAPSSVWPDRGRSWTTGSRATGRGCAAHACRAAGGSRTAT